MKKIVINEFKKFFNGKIFIFELLLIVGLCLIAIDAYKEMSVIAINNLSKAQFYSDDMKAALINIDGITFAKLFLTDFIYKGYFSFFLIFTVITAVNTFSADRESGNMKFTLLTGIDRNTLIMGKLIFMFFAILATVIFNIVFSVVVGDIFFGVSTVVVGEFLELIVLNLFAVFPAVAMTVLVALISQIRISSKVIMAIGIIYAFVMGVLDTSTLTYRFSPIGALSLFPDDVPVINSMFITCGIVSIAYIFVGIVLIIIISPKYEYYE